MNCGQRERDLEERVKTRTVGWWRKEARWWGDGRETERPRNRERARLGERTREIKQKVR